MRVGDRVRFEAVAPIPSSYAEKDRPGPPMSERHFTSRPTGFEVFSRRHPITPFRNGAVLVFVGIVLLARGPGTQWAGVVATLSGLAALATGVRRVVAEVRQQDRDEAEAREISAQRREGSRPDRRGPVWGRLARRADEIDALPTMGQSAFVVRYGSDRNGVAVRLAETGAECSAPTEVGRDGESVRYEMRVKRDRPPASRP
jgi:hypothetical protein